MENPSNSKKNVNIRCPKCRHQFSVTEKDTPKFCPFCSTPLRKKKKSKETHKSDSISAETSITFVPELIPEKKEVRFSIGNYQVLESIGKGGMGEVYLAYDTSCGRRIALKRIREDLIDHPQIQKRFLKEAYVTSQLTHPSIIPIYSIHEEQKQIYYTMPYVEGETLKQTLKTARKQDKLGLKGAQLSSIPSFMRIFLSICQAVAYAHSKGILHRDLKLENVIVGKYGEVVILDWGLAQLIKTAADEKEEEIVVPETPISPIHHITRLGKVVGTIPYMAPERALGQPANFQTDIYSLGVILYQMLTLRHPFKRGTLKEFRQKMSEEQLEDPIEIAPYRDVPRILSSIAVKCLSVSVEQRYKSVDEVIHDLETYLEGRSEWFHIADLQVDNKDDWEFQENVLIAEHTAITRGTEGSDWVSLMISKASFTENTKIEARVQLGEKCQGIGFLLSIPESAQRVHLNDGYCLWLGSDTHRSTKLLRSTVEVMQHPEIFLHRHDWYHIRIEKIDQNIYFYLNNALQFSYISHLPLVGTHIGILSRDADYNISPINVSLGSLNIKVNCLAVPDAFLAHKDYRTALSEYRRIGYSFPGTAEGREAMFRAGITLLEEANHSSDPNTKQKLYDDALEEFWKLHSTPGAPLEYLGKALVYQVIGDTDEEIKCFELAYRRYPHHPLLHVLEEQILYRIYECSRYNRKATYQFILLVLRHIPSILAQNTIRNLLHSLQRHWEPLNFMLKELDISMSDALKNHDFAIHLAFWTAKPYILSEIIDDLLSIEPLPLTLCCNAIYALIELGSYALAKIKINELLKHIPEDHEVHLLNIAIKVYQQPVNKCMDDLFKILTSPTLEKSELRAFMHIIRFAMKKQNYAFIISAIERIKHFHLNADTSLSINCALIGAYLAEKEWKKAGDLLQQYPLETLNQELHPLHILYGIWLYMTEGCEIARIHFSNVLEISFPRSWTLFSHYMNTKIDENKAWLEKAFLWEKRQLYAQAAFFYHCLENKELETHFIHLEAEQYIYAK